MCLYEVFRDVYLVIVHKKDHIKKKPIVETTKERKSLVYFANPCFEVCNGNVLLRLKLISEARRGECAEWCRAMKVRVQ